MKIGELATLAGVAPSAIRYYEASGLLPAARRGANGYRSYPEAALERLRQVRMAQQLGFSLDAIRKVYASGDVLSKDELMRSLDQRLLEIGQLMATMRAQRRQLRTLRSSLIETWANGACL
ncbi:MAG: MerR family transcriptional regulator [Pseudomonadota bacterium]